MRLDDPTSVREEYATEQGLAGRKAAYRFAEGPDARQVAFEAIAEGVTLATRGIYIPRKVRGKIRARIRRD